MSKRGDQNAQKMQRGTDQVAGRRDIDCHRCGDAFGVSDPEVCIFDRGIADRGRGLAHQRKLKK